MKVYCTSFITEHSCADLCFLPPLLLTYLHADYKADASLPGESVDGRAREHFLSLSHPASVVALGPLAPCYGRERDETSAQVRVLVWRDLPRTNCCRRNTIVTIR